MIITDITSENQMPVVEIKKDRRGGKRPGAGRKCIAPDQKRLQRNLYLTFAEEILVRTYVEQMRNGDSSEIFDTEIAKEQAPAIKKGIELRAKGRKSCLSTYRRLQKNFYLTDAENQIVRNFIDKMRTMYA